MDPDTFKKFKDGISHIDRLHSEVRQHLDTAKSIMDAHERKGEGAQNKQKSSPSSGSQAAADLGIELHKPD